MENSLIKAYSPLSPVLEKGDGVFLYDIHGNKYLDFGSGIGVNSLGYNNKILNDSIKAQLDKIQHVSNIFLNPTTVELSNKLTSMAKMSKVFFSNSGAESNEGAIKLARKYSILKYNSQKRTTILSLKKSFHGRTLATLKLTGQDKFHKYFYPFPEGFKYTERNDIKAFKKNLSSDVCAVILEAIQGEGGVYPLDEKFVLEVAKVCKDNDVLLIFDEVQCGIGRTGKLFGFNHFNVEPDIVTVAKGLGGGLPIGGFMCNEKLKDIIQPGDHGSTYGGNPIACASALTVLNYIEKNKLLKNVEKLGLLTKKLVSSSKNILDIRGKGLMIGIETKFNSSEIQKEALKEGLIVLTAGPNTIRLLPPLIINEKEFRNGFQILLKVIDRM